ncbi:MAG: hypothetical protein JKX84_07130, partial [Flavobacteriales bacterium]|nr:hypothetical protein [Flavobacteriales bacterium]
MKKVASIFLSLLFLTASIQAQNGQDTLAKDNRLIPLPTISINFGITNLMSDVALSSNGPSTFTQFGYQLTISQRVTKFLNVSLDPFTGSVYGEEQRNTTNLNFRTSLFSQHLNVEYNFYPLLKPDARGRQLIRPYLGFGVGLISFRSKGDLNAADGTPYQYWSDGNIYAEVEGTVGATEATLLERDYVYETELRDANLDGLRKYPQTAFSLPINAGIRFQVSKNVGLNAAFTYALNFSDMLDNVSAAGVGDRQGNAGNDNHFFASVGLSIFLGTTKPSAKPQRFSDQLADAEKPTADEEKVEV